MGIRTDKGFLYEDGTFITFEDAIKELTESYIKGDDEKFFSREEQAAHARYVIENCQDGAYL